MKRSGFVLLMEGWEKVGKTSLLRMLANAGIGTYEKRSNQQKAAEHSFSSIDLLKHDLREDGYYSRMLKRLDSGQNFLLDRMWPSAYAYGVMRGEDEAELRDLCFRLELKFSSRLIHVFVDKNEQFIENDDKFDSDQREEVMEHYSTFYEHIAWNPIVEIDTTPWHLIKKPTARNAWSFRALAEVLNVIHAMNIR